MEKNLISLAIVTNFTQNLAKIGLKLARNSISSLKLQNLRLSFLALARKNIVDKVVTLFKKEKFVPPNALNVCDTFVYFFIFRQSIIKQWNLKEIVLFGDGYFSLLIFTSCLAGNILYISNDMNNNYMSNSHIFGSAVLKNDAFTITYIT